MYKSKEKRTLTNGLELWIEPKTIGHCVATLIISSGNALDVKPETAHLLEHLKGVEAKIYGEANSLNYAERNASTNFDRTIYYFDLFLPKHIPYVLNNLKVILSEIPDISLLNREREAVKNEIKNKLNPSNLFNEKILRKIFPNHSKYLNGIRKRLAALDTATYQDACLTFWNDHYDPYNVTLYIGGKIPDDLDNLIKDWEKISTRKTKRPVIDWPQEYPLERRIEMIDKNRNDKIALININYQIPSFPKNYSIEENLAKNILIYFLNSTNGPLYTQLRDNLELCYSVGSVSNKFGDASLFTFFAKTGKLSYFRQIEEKWNEIIKKISEEGIPLEFLEIYKDKFEIDSILEDYVFSWESAIRDFKYGIDNDRERIAIESLMPNNIAKVAKDISDRNYLISIELPKEAKH